MKHEVDKGQYVEDTNWYDTDWLTKDYFYPAQDWITLVDRGGEKLWTIRFDNISMFSESDTTPGDLQIFTSGGHWVNIHTQERNRFFEAMALYANIKAKAGEK